jgi:hypothetical protein
VARLRDDPDVRRFGLRRPFFLGEGRSFLDRDYLDVPVTTSWKLYAIRFADFTQTNTGEIFPVIDLSHMYGLEFYFLSSTSFEIWIDDLSFMK